jgi:proteasome lid subunit RPN8/RPN11
VIYLDKENLKQLIEHVKKEVPYEVCGILAGEIIQHSANNVERKVTKVYAMTNVSEKPEVCYFMDPKEQIKVIKEIRNSGKELVGIYHSHPDTSAYPSARDVELAFYPEASYVIVSLKEKDKPCIRSFEIKEGKIVEEEVKIVNSV